MKKLIATALVLLLALTLVSPVFAEVEMITDTVENAFDDKLPATYKDAKKVALGPAWSDGATNARHGNASGNGNSFDYIYLKNDGKGNFVVTFKVDEEAIYDFGFSAMAWKKSVLRTTNVSIDDGPAVRLAYDYVDEDQYKNHYFYGMQAILSAGEHKMVFSLTDDFDDTNVKTLYLYEFFYVSEPIPEVVEEEETTAAPAAAEAPKTTPTAAKTADVFVIAIAALAASTAGVVVSKKRK